MRWNVIIIYETETCTVSEKNGPPEHVKITLWIENDSHYFSLYHEKPSICNVCVKFHYNQSVHCWDIAFYPRDAMLARVIAIATCLSVRLSVRLSVCPSVTSRYCVKTKKASGMISSPSGSLKTLVFWRRISSPNSEGFPPNGGLKQGSVGKIQRFSYFKRQYLENGSRYGQSYY